MNTYLPVLGLALEHHGVFGLADLAIVVLLDLLGPLLCLDAIILGEGSLVAGTAGVGEEVRANGLDGPLDSLGQLANGLEILLGRPALRESRNSARNLYGSHCKVVLCGQQVGCC